MKVNVKKYKERYIVCIGDNIAHRTNNFKKATKLAKMHQKWEDDRPSRQVTLFQEVEIKSVRKMTRAEEAREAYIRG